MLLIFFDNEDARPVACRQIDLQPLFEKFVPAVLPGRLPRRNVSRHLVVFFRLKAAEAKRLA